MKFRFVWTVIFAQRTGNPNSASLRLGSVRETRTSLRSVWVAVRYLRRRYLTFIIYNLPPFLKGFFMFFILTNFFLFSFLLILYFLYFFYYRYILWT